MADEHLIVVLHRMCNWFLLSGINAKGSKRPPHQGYAFRLSHNLGISNMAEVIQVANKGDSIWLTTVLLSWTSLETVRTFINAFYHHNKITLAHRNIFYFKNKQHLLANTIIPPHGNVNVRKVIFSQNLIYLINVKFIKLI